MQEHPGGFEGRIPVTFFRSLGLTLHRHKTFQNLHFLHLTLIINDLSPLFLHQILHQILHQSGTSSTSCVYTRICPGTWYKVSGSCGHAVPRRRIAGVQELFSLGCDAKAPRLRCKSASVALQKCLGCGAKAPRLRCKTASVALQKRLGCVAKRPRLRCETA